jgi:ribonuclease HII
VPKGLNDSKRLSPAVRARLAMELADCAAVGIGVAGVDEIDTLNILRAAHLAMCRAIAALPVAPRCVLIDGNMLPRDLTLPGHAVVGGDRLSLAIAAASIVAKCHRDRLMEDLAQQHDGYGWTTNRGYGTPGHLAALERLGPTPQHRRSFAPVRRILWQEINPTS